MSPSIKPAEAMPSGPPDFLTLDEAAAVLRVGRSTAYREANAFERSGGRTGIPVIRYGKLFRVPRCRLEEQLGGPLTWPPPTARGRTGDRTAVALGHARRAQRRVACDCPVVARGRVLRRTR